MTLEEAKDEMLKFVKLKTTMMPVFATVIMEQAAQPVRRGRWIYLYDGNYRCSECGDWWTCDETPMESGMLYCPNCGAKMDGERRTDERSEKAK